MIGLLSICYISLNANAAYEIQEISFNPKNPTEKSSVTVTVSVFNLSDNDEIYLYIKECDGYTGVCDNYRNFSLTKIGQSNDYTADIDLSFNGATYFDYWFEVYYNGELIRDPAGFETYGPVEYEQGNGDTSNGGGSQDNGTPGFELVIMLLAIIIGIYWFKRKR